MDSVSTSVLSTDLPAYVADLAARVDRLEQKSRPQRSREHMHASVSGPHSHSIDAGQHHHTVTAKDCVSQVGQHQHVVSAYMQ